MRGSSILIVAAIFVACDSADAPVDGGSDDVAVDCDDRHIECYGECVDPMDDDYNCGVCGNVCPVGSVCEWGECICQGSLTMCGDECVSTDSSLEHCGSCYGACDLALADSCVAGECRCAGGPACTPCDYGDCLSFSTEHPEAGCEVCCSAGCVVQDDDHCGLCGNVCEPRDICRGAVATAGTCEIACREDPSVCGTMEGEFVLDTPLEDDCAGGYSIERLGWSCDASGIIVTAGPFDLTQVPRPTEDEFSLTGTFGCHSIEFNGLFSTPDRLQGNWIATLDGSCPACAGGLLPAQASRESE